MQRNEETGSPITFIVSVTLIQILGIVSMILTGIWMGKYRGGFAWDGSGKEFNYHPLCMVIAFVFLYSEAMIVYRVFRFENKFLVKLIHFGLQILGFITAVFGLKAVFDFHNANKIPNMYSLHSWLGISTVVLFSCQLLFGFVGFLFPKFPDSPRASYLKVHVFFGVLIFMMGIATCLLGMTEKTFFSIRTTYSKFVPEGILINVLGMTLVFLASIVLFVVTNSAYKRDNNAPERAALLGADVNADN